MLSKNVFNIPVNGSLNDSYEKLYKQSKSQNANIAVIEERNASSIKGAFYLSERNPFSADNFIKGERNFDYTSNKYTLLNY